MSLLGKSSVPYTQVYRLLTPRVRTPLASIENRCVDVLKHVNPIPVNTPCSGRGCFQVKHGGEHPPVQHGVSQVW